MITGPGGHVRMTVIGFHNSHGQVHPSDLLRARPARRAGGLHRRRECPELGWGTSEVLGQPHPEVLASLSSWSPRAVAGCSDRAAPVDHAR